MTVNTKKARTQAILDHFKGLPGEYYMLKGLLCLDAAVGDPARAWPPTEAQTQVREMYDAKLIARRMDELNMLMQAAQHVNKVEREWANTVMRAVAAESN